MSKIKKFIKDNKREIIYTGCICTLAAVNVLLKRRLMSTDDELSKLQYKYFLLNDENLKLHELLEDK